ncbi:MAG: alanine--tRNA ligase [Vicinamibacteria bacterium]|nr:alanine--tRNA ligase [Vicinamibacteria bacterium]
MTQTSSRFTADDVRAAFLKFFEDREHEVVRSSPLIPQNDPTLLFANAGMNQFKDVFLGRETRAYKRAASSQKCVRAGGKHNDLENVGLTARHHTFFEMLGNFSFGDYFKKDAIAFAWEFLTGTMGLDKDRLTATIFKGEDGVPRDTEAFDHWRAYVPAERILELGKKDNFWAMGDTGPCGPCSELHYYQGDSLPCAEVSEGRACLGVACECDRYLEIWNLVFMQFNRDQSGALTPLPAACVDTGMGLERVTAVVQGKLNNYDTDLFTPLIEATAKLAGVTYGASPATDISLRVIADHLRATTFLVSDGVLPGNEGRGYVLRKIMRRALRHGRKLGLEKPFLADLVSELVARMQSAYPDLKTTESTVKKIVRVEEDRFSTTLKQAFAVFDSVAASTKTGILSGADAFKLYDTYGLSLDFTEELAADRGLKVDNAGFDSEFTKQQERARNASKMGAVSGAPEYLTLLEKAKTAFVGYDHLELDCANVIAVFKDGKPSKRLDKGDAGEIIVDRTPFYAESGGQVGDRGVISAPGSVATVSSCRNAVPGLSTHLVTVDEGSFEPGMVVRLVVDEDRREGAMRHHTATHLLNAALRETLGTHVKQAGSLVANDRLRFDFSHFQGLDERELRVMENRVNGEILANKAVNTIEMTRDEALNSGALAFFGDKYGERVRVVEVPGFSKEFCGGTHVSQTGDIGFFLFTATSGVSAGTRRVEAVAGGAALEKIQRDVAILDELSHFARAERGALVDEYAKLKDELKARDREIERLKMKLASGGGGRSEGSDSVEMEGVTVWTPLFADVDRKGHAALVDEYRQKRGDKGFIAVSTSSSADGSVSVIVAVSRDLMTRLKAPEIMKELGLRGGGRPEFAQGALNAGDDVEALRSKARETAKRLLQGAAV